MASVLVQFVHIYCFFGLPELCSDSMGWSREAILNSCGHPFRRPWMILQNQDFSSFIRAYKCEQNGNELYVISKWLQKIPSVLGVHFDDFNSNTYL